MKDPCLADTSSASVWLCGCRVASGTARGEVGSGWEGEGVGREQELGKEGSLEKLEGGGEQATQLLRMCVHVSPWAQGSSQALSPVTVTQGVWGGPGNLHYKRGSVDRGKGAVSKEHGFRSTSSSHVGGRNDATGSGW